MIRRTFGPLACAGLLVLGSACDRSPAGTQLYLAHEVGLTLAFENPSLPAAQRSENRLQVRVGQVTPAPTGGQLIASTYTTLKGEFTVTTLLKDGGLQMLGPDGKPIARLLPEGFPDRVSTWTDRGQRFTVLGRAMLPELQAELPRGFGRLGIWIESRPLQEPGMVVRSFFLPDIGEVETREYRAGQWLTVNRLASAGFTDAPPPTP